MIAGFVAGGCDRNQNKTRKTWVSWPLVSDGCDFLDNPELLPRMIRNFQNNYGFHEVRNIDRLRS